MTYEMSDFQKDQTKLRKRAKDGEITDEEFFKEIKKLHKRATETIIKEGKKVFLDTPYGYKEISYVEGNVAYLYDGAVVELTPEEKAYYDFAHEDETREEEPIVESKAKEEVWYVVSSTIEGEYSEEEVEDLDKAKTLADDWSGVVVDMHKDKDGNIIEGKRVHVSDGYRKARDEYKRDPDGKFTESKAKESLGKDGQYGSWVHKDDAKDMTDNELKEAIQDMDYNSLHTGIHDPREDEIHSERYRRTVMAHTIESRRRNESKATETYYVEWGTSGYFETEDMDEAKDKAKDNDGKVFLFKGGNGLLDELVFPDPYAKEGGTSAGAKKAWDRRGRGRKAEDEPEITQTSYDDNPSQTTQPLYPELAGYGQKPQPERSGLTKGGDKIKELETNKEERAKGTTHKDLTLQKKWLSTRCVHAKDRSKN